MQPLPAFPGKDKYLLGIPKARPIKQPRKPQRIAAFARTRTASHLLRHLRNNCLGCAEHLSYFLHCWMVPLRFSQMGRGILVQPGWRERQWAPVIWWWPVQGCLSHGWSCAIFPWWHNSTAYSSLFLYKDVKSANLRAFSPDLSVIYFPFSGTRGSDLGMAPWWSWVCSPTRQSQPSSGDACSLWPPWEYSWS